MLSERQIQLLNAIITEYVSSTTPVGSEIIVQKYKIKCSAATVRNEMAKLIDEGFLQMLHTSSGRVPTPMAYKYFLTETMEEEEMPVLQEVAMKQRLWPSRFEFYKFLKDAALVLSDTTKELSIVTTNDGFVVSAGAVNILDNREFWDIDNAKAALYILDRFELLEEIFRKGANGGEVRYVIGEEMGIPNLNNTSMIFAPYTVGKKSGHVAVFGPSRMRYQNVIPAVKFTKNLVEEMGESW